MPGRTRRVTLHNGASVLISAEPARPVELPTLQAAKFVPGDFGEPPPLPQVQGGRGRASGRKAFELANAHRPSSPRKRAGLRARQLLSQSSEAAPAPPPAEEPPDEEEEEEEEEETPLGSP